MKNRIKNFIPFIFILFLRYILINQGVYARGKSRTLLDFKVSGAVDLIEKNNRLLNFIFIKMFMTGISF